MIFPVVWGTWWVAEEEGGGNMGAEGLLRVLRGKSGYVSREGTEEEGREEVGSLLDA